MIMVSDIPAPPLRPCDAHKGTFGTVVVVGGTMTMIGAPALTATAAFRAGAGLVKIMASISVIPHCLTIEPSATGMAFPGMDDPTSIESYFLASQENVVLAVGPGMGFGTPNLSEGIGAILKTGRPTVLDADGLNNLSRLGDTIGKVTQPLVLTPHPGEFSRLAKAARMTLNPIDPAQRPAAAQALAMRYGAVVALKGQHTVVSDGARCYINQTGNPALATAGSGDVLTGVIASLMAQGMPAFEATVLGVYVHGSAADQWTAAHGPCGMLARDLAQRIPDALHTLRLANTST